MIKFILGFVVGYWIANIEDVRDPLNKILNKIYKGFMKLYNMIASKISNRKSKKKEDDIVILNEDGDN